ncbi:hypothetical protein TNCV_922021 [Trichonephila clavipes]|nr:hypothetical protein TNCV_922021 [Trichonephila clavipes]
MDSNNLIIPEQHGFRPDHLPTLKSGGNDQVGIQKTQIDWCGFPRYLKSLRPSGLAPFDPRTGTGLPTGVADHWVNGPKSTYRVSFKNPYDSNRGLT